MGEPCTSGMNDSTSTSTCSTHSPSKIPVRTYKRKLDVCTLEPEAKQLKLVPIQVMEPIVQIAEDEIYQEEPVVEIVPQCNRVQDIRSVFKRFQEFNTKMVLMNQSLYLRLGLHEAYDRIEKQLSGYLGELHYYREKEDALNTYNSQQD